MFWRRSSINSTLKHCQTMPLLTDYQHATTRKSSPSQASFPGSCTPKGGEKVGQVWGWGRPKAAQGMERTQTRQMSLASAKRHSRVCQSRVKVSMKSSSAIDQHQHTMEEGNSEGQGSASVRAGVLGWTQCPTNCYPCAICPISAP